MFLSDPLFWRWLKRDETALHRSTEALARRLDSQHFFFVPGLELPCPYRIAIKAPAGDPVRQCRALTDDPCPRRPIERH